MNKKNPNNPLNKASLESTKEQLIDSISDKLNEKEIIDLFILSNEEIKNEEKKFEEAIIYGRKGDTFSKAKKKEIDYLNKNEKIVINEVLKLMTSSSSPNIIFPEEISNGLSQEDFEIS